MGRNILKLDTTGFDRLIDHLKELDGEVQKAVTDALEQAGETITADTHEAVSPPNLPRGGKYSHGDTEASIVAPKVSWVGTTAEMPVGFDFAKPGAGGYLITGTPKMRPDMALQKIYKRKKYMHDIQNDMAEVVQDYIAKALRGG